PDRERDLELIRLQSQDFGIARKDEQPAARDVGRDHLQARAVLRVVPLGAQVGKRVDALVGEEAAHPVDEVVALVDAVRDQDAERLADNRDPVLPRAILEPAEVEAEDDLAELVRGVAGGDQRRGDRARRGAGDVLRLPALLLERGVRAREPDALDPAALADEIDAVILFSWCGHFSIASPDGGRGAALSLLALVGLLEACSQWPRNASGLDACDREQAPLAGHALQLGGAALREFEPR